MTTEIDCLGEVINTLKIGSTNPDGFAEMIEALKVDGQGVLYISSDSEHISLMKMQFLATDELEIVDYNRNGCWRLSNGSYVSFVWGYDKNLRGISAHLVVAHKPQKDIINTIIAPMMSVEGTRVLICN